MRSVAAQPLVSTPEGGVACGPRLASAVGTKTGGSTIGNPRNCLVNNYGPLLGTEAQFRSLQLRKAPLKIVAQIASDVPGKPGPPGPLTLDGSSS